MSTYKALVGKKIKSVSSDPSNSAEGQMWYNTTTQSLRGLGVLEAWSSASPVADILQSRWLSFQFQLHAWPSMIHRDSNLCDILK